MYWWRLCPVRWIWTSTPVYWCHLLDKVVITSEEVADDSNKMSILHSFPGYISLDEKERDGSCERLRKCDLGGGQRVSRWQEVSVPALQPEGGFWTSAERRPCKHWWEKTCSLPKVATRNFKFWFILVGPRTERNRVDFVQCCSVQADHRAASFHRLWGSTVCSLQSKKYRSICLTWS